jgi:hypothetical protein
MHADAGLSATRLARVGLQLGLGWADWAWPAWLGSSLFILCYVRWTDLGYTNYSIF